MARRVKSLRNNKKGISPNHRDHRSKKNRRPVNKQQLAHLKAFKLRKARLTERELDEEIKNYDV